MLAMTVAETSERVAETGDNLAKSPEERTESFQSHKTIVENPPNKSTPKRRATRYITLGTYHNDVSTTHFRNQHNQHNILQATVTTTKSTTTDGDRQPPKE